MANSGAFLITTDLGELLEARAAGAALVKLAAAAPRRLEIHIGGPNTATVRIRMNGKHSSAMRGRQPEMQVTGETLLQAVERAAAALEVSP